MNIEWLVWFFTILGGVVAFLLLIRPTINAIKWLIPPRLDADFAEYTKGYKQDNPCEIHVTPDKPIKAGIRILPKWTYRLRIIEVLGHGLRVTRTRIFAKRPRAWTRDAYTDIHGDYKISLYDFVIRRGGVSDPTIVDVKITPIRKGERKKISLRIETEESRTLFIKDLWMSA